jgi:TIR domain
MTTNKAIGKNNAAKLFGYDIFVSFALGPPPRGTLSYASDLVRRLRESNYNVFFSEHQVTYGEALDESLKKALKRSKTLVVILNKGTLSDPRWVRAEVEEYNQYHKQRRAIIPISIGGALNDPRLTSLTQEWLKFNDIKWLDESEAALQNGVASNSILAGISGAVKGFKSNMAWKWTLRFVIAGLSVLSVALAIEVDSANKSKKEALERAAEVRKGLISEKKAKDEAVQAGKVALSRQLIAQSNASQETNIQAALLFAKESTTVNPSFETHEALLLTLGKEPRLLWSTKVNTSIAKLSYSLNGRYLAFTENGGDTYVRDNISETASSMLILDGVRDLWAPNQPKLNMDHAFSQNGDFLYTGGFPNQKGVGQVSKWNLSSCSTSVAAYILKSQGEPRCNIDAFSDYIDINIPIHNATGSTNIKENAQKKVSTLVSIAAINDQEFLAGTITGQLLDIKKNNPRGCSHLSQINTLAKLSIVI